MAAAQVAVAAKVVTVNGEGQTQRSARNHAIISSFRSRPQAAW